jgi:hypothetical protein
MDAEKRTSTRERWYRDPTWQFVGAVLALAAIGVSVWFFVLQRDVKSVQAVLLAETSMVDIADAVTGEMQAIYHDRPIPNLKLAQVKVENNGTVEVRSSDYEAPITIVVPEGAEVLDVKVVAAKPTDLGIETEVKGRNIVLAPKLLNPGDVAVLRLVLAGMPEMKQDLGLKAAGRIAGVKEIRMVSTLTEQDFVANVIWLRKSQFAAWFVAFVGLLSALSVANWFRNGLKEERKTMAQANLILEQRARANSDLYGTQPGQSHDTQG